MHIFLPTSIFFSTYMKSSGILSNLMHVQLIYPLSGTYKPVSYVAPFLVVGNRVDYCKETIYFVNKEFENKNVFDHH